MAPGVRPGFQVSNECLPPRDVCLRVLSSQLRDVSAPTRTSRRHLFSTQRKFPLMCCDAGAKEAVGASLFFYFLSFFFFFSNESRRLRTSGRRSETLAQRTLGWITNGLLPRDSMTARISCRRGDSRQHAGYRLFGWSYNWIFLHCFYFWFGVRASRWQQCAIKCCKQAGGTARKRGNVANEGNVRNFHLKAASDLFV